MFVFAVAACGGGKVSIYDEYEDSDSESKKGGIGDPCLKSSDCMDGLVCLNKVCREPANTDDDNAEDDSDEPDNDDADSGSGGDDSDSGHGTNDDDSDSGSHDGGDTETEDDDTDSGSDEDPYMPECGNGTVEMGEECDNGFANTDEPGILDETCRTNCRFARCGDGIVDKGATSGKDEVCDDGNRLNGDYCSSDCSEITGWCGDGKIQITIETCDNADKSIGSHEGIGAYCASDCSEIVGSCGDGIKQTNEACDNAEPGEGGGQGTGSYYCSYDCMDIIGWCGDGTTQTEVEACDEGQRENGGHNGEYGHCNTTCTAETYCGDGIVQSPHEKCDDGNNENGDYCSADCQTSNGSCGDGILQWFEICDKAEPGYGNKQGIGAYCSDDCKQIVGKCGDGEKQANEECDKGGNNGNKTCEYGPVIPCEVCSDDCKKISGTARYCGDGITQGGEGEKCDDGNENDGDYCSSDCKAITGSCGDGKKQDNEACDTALDPYCSDDCKSIAGYCGDGKVNGDEQCDRSENENGIVTDCAYGETSCKVCDADCKEADGIPHFCGDHNKDEANGEKCDDGRELNGSYGHCKADCSGIGEHCGDNVKNGNEDCDLGEEVNGTITDCAYGETSCKVCSANCTEIDGNISFCGDGMVDPDNEACDKALDPYCADNCKSTIGECGDGTVQPNETCDKADPSVGEGQGTGAYCSFDCTESFGYCGDGQTKGPEKCDDEDDNGKYKLTYPPYCNASCSARDSGYCGDKKIQNSSCGEISDCTEMPDAAEECDEGSANGKTQCEYGETSCTVCNSSCQIREGVTSRCGDNKFDQEHEACEKTLDPYCAEDCKSRIGSCGDGTVQPNETCDKADPSVGEGQGIGAYCSSDCQTLLGECGDGKIQPNETCDKADPGVGEGQGTGAYCSFDCTQSFGYCGDGEWQNEIEVCEKTLDPYCADDCQSVTGECGDGKIQPNEACDNAGPSVGEGEGTGAYCSADCTESLGYCGDNQTQGNETCDDGTGENGNGTYGHCNETCDGYMPRCGDSNTDTDYGETCDEGNGVNGTYGHCSNDCKYIMECGDGFINGGESCDSGENFNGTYGNCNDSCTAITGYCGDKKIQRTDCTGYGSCIQLDGGDEECDNGTYLNGKPNCAYGETSCTVCTAECKNAPGKTARCGDNRIQKGTIEACEAYVAIDPENNKLCSDTVTENCCEVFAGTNEACDDGALNGTFGKCDDTCTTTVTWKCGDGNIDWEHGETCDDEDYNGTPHHCNNSCNGPTPYCGDGRTQREICKNMRLCSDEVTDDCCEIVEGMNERCDDGEELNGTEAYCYTDCSGYCGDGVVQEDHEACDEGYRLNGQPGHCNQICTGNTAVCGNGELEYGEVCDDGNTDDGDYCSANCKRITGRCGDGDTQSNETCDEGEENNGYHGHCNMACDGTSACGDGKLGKDEICDGSLRLFDTLQCSDLPQFTNGASISECLNCMPVLSACTYDSSYKSSFFVTGQTLCYDDTGATITPCPESGEDFYGQEPNFNYMEHDYETIENGEIIVDHNSGLMWMAATPSIYGLEIEGYGYHTCTEDLPDPGKSCTAEEADGYCDFVTVGDYDKWRLPTAAELSTIMDFASATHMYSGFTNTNGFYWTEGELLFSSADGTLTPSTGSETANVKCVRDIDSGCTSPQCIGTDSMTVFDAPDSIITVLGGETSINFWYFGNPSVSDTWEGALQFCNDPSNPIGLDSMRLPTVNELISLIDSENGGSLIPGFTGKAWTSTTVVSAPASSLDPLYSTNPSAHAYAVDFSTGSVVIESKANNNIIICVE